MESLNKYQWHIFGAFCVTIALVIALRFIVLLPLYQHRDLQQRASAIIQATVAREGWLSSGLTLKQISEQEAVVLYRSPVRGVDTLSCYRISFTTGELSPCV